VGDLTGDVLEIGAGTGATLAHYRRASRLVMLEPDPRYRERLRRHAAGHTPAVEVIAGSAERLPFADGSFDHVVCSLVLCSVEDLDAALREAARVLRPGGRLHLIEHVRGHGRLAAWQRRLTPVQRRLADGCRLDRNPRSAIERAGFDVLDWEGFRLPRGHPLIRDAVQASAVRGTAAPT
jgi:ubiquinone/menaquinone biosynthesis C-methylase UbiE